MPVVYNVSVQILSNFISGRNRIYIQSGRFPPTFKSLVVCMIRKLEKSEHRKDERNSFLAYSFPAAQTVRSGEANVQLLNKLTPRCFSVEVGS